MLLPHFIGANLSVAFVSDPLNLNLFPPHVSGVAVGGAGGSGEVRGRGRLSLYFFRRKTPGLSQLVLSVRADAVGSSRAGGLSRRKFKKRKKKRKEKDREKEERKNGVRWAAPSSDHGPVSGGRSSTLRLNRGPLPSPSPQLGSS